MRLEEQSVLKMVEMLFKTKVCPHQELLERGRLGESLEGGRHRVHLAICSRLGRAVVWGQQLLLRGKLAGRLAGW